MLTPLQEQVAEIIAGLEEAKGFALAGGAALIARGDVRRETRDLDFFGLTPDAVDRLAPAVDRALRDTGLAVHQIQVNPGFARLIVESADERTELDLAADARLFPAEPGEPAPMLRGEELAVDTAPGPVVARRSRLWPGRLSESCSLPSSTRSRASKST